MILLDFTLRLTKAFKLIFFLAFPSVIGLIIFAEPILGTIFQRGEFLWSDVENSSLSLIGFAVGLPFFMAMKVLVPAFFFQGKTQKLQCLLLELVYF